VTAGPLQAVEAHLAAFNARDTDAVLAGFAEDAVFASGDLLVVGRRGLARLFAEAFSGEARAALEIRRAVVTGDTVACELRELVAFAGGTTELEVAAFFTVREGRLVRVKVYREGAA
jgi:hypothetical protein